MVGWHHRLNGHEFEPTLGDAEGQESLECRSLWSCRVGRTEQRQHSISSKIFLKSRSLSDDSNYYLVRMKGISWQLDLHALEP